MKNIKIPNPCSENWELMSPQEKGKFCAVCNKCVIDFTQKQPQEIVQILEKNNDIQICGRFYNHQIGENIDKPQALRTAFQRYIPSFLQNNRIGLSLLSMILFVIGCSKPKEENFATTRLVTFVEEDSLSARDQYTMGEPQIAENDSIAKISKKKSKKECEVKQQKK
ncbi:hypothetical protein [Chryseobacterium sp. Mn2064]|uniref:hypothetical protein n=1 Tax=Chryseobacterium sp. Mn2064 TaxID=3395263 RepID=UPI003BE7491B